MEVLNKILHFMALIYVRRTIVSIGLSLTMAQITGLLGNIQSLNSR